jgi:Zn finger protein HypA/HybF involved in hydrogenase expression
MLPVKLYSGKSKNSSAFGALFGENGLSLATDLLKDALKTESDVEIRNEIEKRLKLLNPKEANVVKCSQCHKPFQPKKVRKYKQYLCSECVSLKYAPKTERMVSPQKANSGQ